MKYIAKLLEIDAVQFLGEDEGMPAWLSVKGTKLPPKEREAEFYDQVSKEYPRASYSDWILSNGEDRWVLKDTIFKKMYQTSSKTTHQEKTDSNHTSTPVLEGSSLLGLGFR